MRTTLQNMAAFITTAAGTSNPTKLHKYLLIWLVSSLWKQISAPSAPLRDCSSRHESQAMNTLWIVPPPPSWEWTCLSLFRNPQVSSPMRRLP
jgi:hypothetical protein